MARKPADQSVSREEILLAAANVLYQNGYESTTMKDIASEVNLTAASLYHHFRNKSMLLLAVLQGGIDHLIAQIDPIIQSDKSNAEKLSKMIKLHVIGVTQHKSVGVAMVFEIRSLLNIKAQNNKDNKEIIEQRNHFFSCRDHFEGLFRKVIHAGIDAGEFRDVDAGIFVKSLLGAQNWVAVWYNPDGRLSGEDVAQMMAENSLKALSK